MRPASWDPVETVDPVEAARIEPHSGYACAGDEIDDGLEAHLRGYLFRLGHRGEPRPGEAMPVL
ncbi:hypothetical protein [Streptomyces sp. A0592]|uniref:hypothetical protein n=1 Tax=Streptomyces sp. A0592 TaxID=2563099 RepID=UPI00109E49A6|nr:hypothetical protein [Streptomyces sp. A0592]THA84832.1 hypothetical protein E6U81_10485 [Streptomyces sp. A0592]